MKKLYTNEAVNSLVEKYFSKDGNIKVIDEGCLASYGLAILYGEGLKTTIIKEVYLNEWSSGNSIISYNKMPKKYAKLLA